MAYDLYPLLPSLKPCETVDKTYTQYLDQSHAPIINPLKKALHIELYNTKWFDKPLKTSLPSFIYKHNTLKLLTESNSPFPSVFEPHDKTNTCPPKPLFEIVYYNISTSPPHSPFINHSSRHIATFYSVYYGGHYQTSMVPCSSGPHWNRDTKNEVVTYRRFSCSFSSTPSN